ncbi:MAG TPA: hypothetical protein VHB21_28000, partial [Minicystis sp.]|nr:hypothetical protein [Minicystis sp.]
MADGEAEGGGAAGGGEADPRDDDARAATQRERALLRLVDPLAIALALGTIACRAVAPSIAGLTVGLDRAVG